MLQLPDFSESNHPIVKSLFHYTDSELVTLFQRHPDEGKYFTALFCRYHAIVYSLIQHQVKSPVQGDYLFALTWRHIFHELRGLDLFLSGANFTFQTWLINTTALCLKEAQLPPVEAINYSLAAAPPPLMCYVQEALDMMPPRQRLVMVMAETFHWSETRIAGSLQAEQETISPTDAIALLQEGYRSLESLLPEDICAIYLENNSADRVPLSAAAN
ncbi:sigma-70 family RNA polymerase sigma factor [[Phormidium] sp. ETS-05]|uniref:sigma-70 family RNA polymerase sigma factor n=1 Tax=[Phormidium] sp. ETS-05 TaxID=222819 RepID=UPI0018EEDEFE|nr:sigma-70 family RNA polymerase sigma factor [[Phormidium] sp. ETS-05]